MQKGLPALLNTRTKYIWVFNARPKANLRSTDRSEQTPPYKRSDGFLRCGLAYKSSRRMLWKVLLAVDT